VASSESGAIHAGDFTTKTRTHVNPCDRNALCVRTRAAALEAS
jgi:hypothetical protein